MEGGADLLALADAGRKVEEIYYCPSKCQNADSIEYLDKFIKLGIPTVSTSPQAQEKASYRSLDKDLIGVVKSWDISLLPESIYAPGPVVVLDEIEKPGNLGAILRSVEAFGGSGVILSDSTVDFFNPNVIRSSRGLMGSVPVLSGNKGDVWNWLKNSQRQVLATSSRATDFLGIDNLPKSVAFIFGSEKFGLCEFWDQRVKKWIKIPMHGTASSLNLNVSVGCVLYEYNRT